MMELIDELLLFNNCTSFNKEKAFLFLSNKLKIKLLINGEFNIKSFHSSSCVFLFET